MKTDRILAVALVAALCGCGGGGGSTPTPQPQPSSSAPGTTAFTCPTSDTAASLARNSGVEGAAMHRMMPRANQGATPATSLIAVRYERAVATTSTLAIATRERNLGANPVQSFDFPHVGAVVHVLSVPASNLATTLATLRAQPGVQSAGLTGQARALHAVSAPYWTNDPYFNGFTTTIGGAAPTYHVAPYAESAGVPGQWDMHALRLEYAFAYSQLNNGSGQVNSRALGSSSVKLAVIDTGQDTTHPELQGKIAYQRCFITSPNGTQSTSNFTVDADGHGTDVSGIATAATNNGFGFASTGGNTSLYGYRVFPTPDANCDKANPTAAECFSSTLDIAAAIDDAVNQQHVNVINLSLGGGTCSSGQDPDSTEGTAIAEAIAANVIVVASSGNQKNTPPAAPACDPGVIAVGASSLADGQPNGSNYSGTGEYVASYSEYGSPASSNCTLTNCTAWGIVAPGGDPTSATDADDLHWIENLWTSTPYDAADAGQCTDDYPSSNAVAPVDCRTLIAGTSMAAPHVAGAAALILAVNPAYQSPSKMKALLCTYADHIGTNDGCGRLDVYRAMAIAVGDTDPGP